MAHAIGVRTPYEAIPAAVRAWADRELGSSVVSAKTQQGGFSPGTAARLVTASGRRAFVKAVGPELNPDTPTLFRNEITAMRAVSLPQAPILYSTYDDGAWVGLLLEDIDGALPVHPWRQDDADRVVFVDWAFASRATPWADTVFVQAEMRSSVRLPPLPDNPGATGFLAGVAGGLLWGSRREAPPGLPTIRTWQSEQAEIYLTWLRERLGW